MSLSPTFILCSLLLLLLPDLVKPFKENCWTFCATADKLLTDLREITQPLD